MSEQSTTTNVSAEPVLCKNGCGFFGNSATGNCCSKCFRESQKKDNDSASQVTAAPSPEPTSTQPPAPQPAPAEEPSPMEVDTVEPTDFSESTPTPVSEDSAVKPEQKKRKKKKKTSYKNMMANMTKRNKDEADIQKEKEGLRKVTGGGEFSKIDRI